MKLPPQQTRRYDFYFPLQYNDGRDIEREKFDQTERELFGRFNGLTSIKRDFPLRGMWGSETAVYEDEIIILTAIDFSANLEETGQFIAGHKEKLRTRFEQEEILITGPGFNDLLKGVIGGIEAGYRAALINRLTRTSQQVKGTR